MNDSDTEYAAGYVETRFRSIPVGASEADVVRELGQPLSTKTFPDGDTCWYYSQHGKKSENYYVRAVRFDSGKRVTELLTGFYLD
jgi:outer membrane protein assembly factor BamE (lipoprotein component of BamABCDE complex)